MRISSVEFVMSAAKREDYPRDDLPEIVLVGKSNVGKSSLINNIIGRKRLAKTSSTPGKTRTINFYLVNRSFYLVDLPGFGYAKASLGERKKWQAMIESYLGERENIVGGLLVLDIRRGPADVEEGVYSWFEGLDIELVTILTKADKLSNNKITAAKAHFKREWPGIETVLFSAMTGRGKDDVKKKITELLA